jgi:hypothetical protein
MLKFLHISLILVSVNLFAQINNASITDNTFLFSFKNNSYVISDDSIFRLDNNKTWIGHEHKLLIKDFVFFHDSKKGYLMHNSGGVIYSFDGYNFNRIDDSFEFNTQYQSFPFLYKNSIYNFGGYGLFTFKNIITYFNESKKETELVIVKTPGSKHPKARKKMFAQLVEDRLYIGSGFGYDTEILDGYKKGKVFNDYWCFDFSSKEWNQIGTGKQLIDDEKYSVVYDFEGKNLVITTDAVYSIDIENNKIQFFENANIDLIKSKKKDLVKDYITYNSHRKGFYLILEKPNTENKILFVTAAEFLGNPTRSEELYSKDDNSNIYIGSLLISIFVLLFIITKKKSDYKKVFSKRHEIELILTHEECEIFKLIIEKHPQYIPFPELMDVFEPHLNYDSRKKKLRHSLYQIENKIKVVLKTKKSIFIERKNKEDQRIKEIRIQS